MIDAIVWFFQGLALGVVNVFRAIATAPSWLNWSDPEAVIRFVYYGASWEFFFVVVDIILILVVASMVWRRFGWAVVRGLEAFGNVVGRVAAWAGLIMVLQQIVIIFIQRIFTRAEISMGFGVNMSRDISWWAEELKLYNAMIVALCVSYTFIQGGHVRVDLIYSAVSHRAKRIIDMIGSVIFMLPMAALTYFYGWFFLWRHMFTPKLAASDASKELDQLLMKARAFRWNVETIGFSPNGFDAYFLFKILLVAFTVLVAVQAVAFFIRSYLELVEGPEAADKYLDRDVIEQGEVEMAAPQRLAHDHQA